MEMKELKINIPDGYDIDRENSTLERIIFKKKGEIRYDDVVRELFKVGDIAYYISSSFGVSVCPGGVCSDHHCKTRLQAEKLDSINKLLNVAKYLNGNWNPNWRIIGRKKWYIQLCEDEIEIASINNVCNYAIVYFKTEEDAQRAIDILGVRTIKLALSTDW